MSMNFFLKTIIAMMILLISEGFSQSKGDCLDDSQYLKFKTAIKSSLVNSWCSPEKAEMIMDLIVSEKLYTCVEIGVFTGSSFLPIASGIQYLGKGQAYAIDAWSNEEAIRYVDEKDPNKYWWANVNMHHAHLVFQDMIQSRGLQQWCTEMHCPSELAVIQFSEIDFLHLDGNYTTEGSLKDAYLYSPKVKKGGYILVSNAHICINQDLPKLDVLYYLEEFCELVKVLEGGNAFFYRKIK
jgi:hypothetical protein